MAMSKDWKTEIVIVEPYMIVLSAAQVKRVDELSGSLEKAILADICRAYSIPSYFFEEEGSREMGKQLLLDAIEGRADEQRNLTE